MPSQIFCPECHAAFAYSPALLGRNVQCAHCAARFDVTSPPTGDLVPPADPARALAPPPLPARRPASAPRPPRDDEPPEPPPRRTMHRDRPSGTGMLIGLVAAFVVAFGILAGGVGYLLWPSPSRTKVLEGPAPPPVAAAPVPEDRPKPLEDVLKEAPRRDGQPPAGGAGPGFPNPQPAMPPNFPGPPGGWPGAGPGGPFNPGGFGPGISPPGGPPIGVPPVGAMPGFGQPGVPMPGVGPTRPAGPAPKFAKLNPLPIKPARFSGDRAEVSLSGPVESVTVAGGGRFLLLHIPSKKKLAVFDVSEAKVAKELDVADPEAKVAGGMNFFLIYQPGTNTIERWGLEPLDRQYQGDAPFKDPVRAMAMGAASNGPLAVAMAGSRKTFNGGCTLAFFDPAKLTEVPYARAGLQHGFGIGDQRSPAAVRASANGRLFTGWGPGSPSGAEAHVIEQNVATRYQSNNAPRPLLPAADGRLALANGAPLRPEDIQQPRIPVLNAPALVPATSGGWSVRVRFLGADPRGDERAMAVEVLQANGLLAGPAFENAADIDRSRAEQGLDQTVVLVPEAKVLITVAAPKRSTLILRRVGLK